jgi:L-lactate dehydrogenase
VKVGIIGAGAVGASCTLSLILRACAREIVLVDKDALKAEAVAIDMSHGVPLSSDVTVRGGSYEDLKGAALVIITAGRNEKSEEEKGAIDPEDKFGRLWLLTPNAKEYRQIVKDLCAIAPDTVILVVTDPPDPLADLTREIAGHNRVLSSGTFLDTLRFRVQLARRCKVSANSVEALVVGEHGISQVLLWSTARICGVPIRNFLDDRGEDQQNLRSEIENDVKRANITIIEGNRASQFGIGMTVARIAEIILRDEKAVIPIGSFNPKYGLTLSLPGVVGRDGVEKIIEPEMSVAEQDQLKNSADLLQTAKQRFL